MRRRHLSVLAVALVSMFVAGGGLIHLRQWLDVYRHVPAGAAGAAVVRLGFPLTSALSVVVVGALLFATRRRWQHARSLVLAILVFQAGALATLIATRVGSVLGWSETTWTPAARATFAVEAAAIVALAALALLLRRDRTASEVTAG